ncbi:MAG: DnaD domain protein [Peptostreptococcales bacterium]|jgi:DnaD/phage-associated family protein
MRFKKEKSHFYLNNTPIENMFIHEYMPLADGDFVKVYLFALMYAERKEALSNEIISKHLNIQIEDVLKAWTYWEKQGVIRKIMKSRDNPFHYDVEFLSLKQLFINSNLNCDAPSLACADISDPTDTDLVFSSMENPSIKEMFAQIEAILGRSFQGNEMFEILDWVNQYHMEPQVIVQAYNYASTKNNNNFSYIATIIRNWHDSKIKTMPDLERFFEQNNDRQNIYKRIMRALGLHFRFPSEEEKRIIDIWFDTYKFDLNTVLDACKKTSGISNPNINYIHTIVKSWYNKQMGIIEDKSTGNSKGSSKITVKDVLKEYDNIRQKNNKIVDDRIVKVYSSIPRIRFIDEEMSKLSISISKVVLMGSDDSKKQIERIKKNIDNLNQEKAFLLTENNYPINFLDPLYDCQGCQDTGTLANGEQCPCFKEKLNK